MPFQKFFVVVSYVIENHKAPTPWLGDGLHSHSDVRVGMGFTQLCAPHMLYMVVTKPQIFVTACYPLLVLHNCDQSRRFVVHKHNMLGLFSFVSRHSHGFFCV